jgi:hypothetical protein
MNGDGNPCAYDAGVEIGTQGIGAGGNEYQTAMITVAWPVFDDFTFSLSEIWWAIDFGGCTHRYTL